MFGKVDIFAVSLVLLLILKSFSSRYIHYERFLDPYCETDPDWEYYNNRSTPDARYCSDFLFHRSGQFEPFNGTHIRIQIYSEGGCPASALTNESYTLVMDICYPDPIVVGKYAKYKFVTMNPFPGPHQKMANSMDWLRQVVFIDMNCTERDRLKFHYLFVPMRKEYYTFQDSAQEYRVFDEQVLVTQCNKSHILEYVLPESKATKPVSSSEWEELAITHIHHTCQTDRFFDRSYHFLCVDDVPLQPTDLNPYFQMKAYWNPSCYGAEYYNFERHNDFCIPYPAGNVVWGRKDYFAQTGHMRKYFYQANCSESSVNLVLYETSTTNLGCIHDDSSTTVSRYVRFEDAVESFSDPDFYTAMYHEESCQYYEENEKIWEEVKRTFRENNMNMFHYHNSFCISEGTLKGFGLSKTSSQMGRCEKGVFQLTNFSDHTNCDVLSHGDVSYSSGDLCMKLTDDFQGFWYVTFTCVPFYCNKIPQYSSDVCSGKGTCFDTDQCACDSANFGGQFCELEDVEFSKQVTSGLPQWLVTTLTVSLPTGFASFILIIFFILVGCFFCCSCAVFVITLLSCSVLGISLINLAQKRRISRFKKLKGFELLLQEQLLENDSSVAHLKINKVLFEIPLDEVKIDGILGEGGSNSVVYRAMWKNQQVAFKCFRTKTVCSNQERFNEFEAEVSILGSLSHPNIVRYFGATLQPPRVGIVMEYCECGEILLFVRQFRMESNFGYPIPEKLRMCRQIIDAVDYIHSRSILHRDLKCENVLLDSNEDCKLMDFGLSRLVNEQNSAKTKNIGTDAYMAPEILSGTYNLKVDTFAFSILIYSLFSEKNRAYDDVGEDSLELRVAQDPSFRPNLNDLILTNDLLVEEEDVDDDIDDDDDDSDSDDNSTNLLMKEMNKKRKISGRSRKNYEWLKDIMRKCWEHNPSKRPDFSELSAIFNDVKYGGSKQRSWSGGGGGSKSGGHHPKSLSLSSGRGKNLLTSSLRRMSRSNYREMMNARSGVVEDETSLENMNDFEQIIQRKEMERLREQNSKLVGRIKEMCEKEGTDPEEILRDIIFLE